MALTRIQFDDGSGYYTVPINPLEFDNQDSDQVSVMETLDGGTVEQYPNFDARVRTFTWRNLPQKEPYLAMVTELKSYKGIGPILLKLNTIDFGSATEITIKVVNVSTTIKAGAGSAASPYKMTWDEIVVSWVKVRV